MANPDFPQLLGRYIFVANPYEAATPPAEWDPPDPAALTYPAGTAANTANGWFAPCFDEAEIEEYGGHWQFKGTQRYVARAVRIPYMYYRDGENGGKILAVDHFLIGFEGGSGQ